MIRMKEPTDPQERQAAIRICLANAGYDVVTREPIEDREESMKQWRSLSDDVPYAKWLWMWNNGRAEWDPKYEHTSREGQ